MPFHSKHGSVFFYNIPSSFTSQIQERIVELKSYKIINNCFLHLLNQSDDIVFTSESMNDFPSLKICITFQC